MNARIETNAIYIPHCPDLILTTLSFKMFCRHSLTLTLILSLLVSTSCFFRVEDEEQEKQLGRLMKLEATQTSLIRDMQGKGVMKTDEKKEELGVEIVDDEVKKALKGNKDNIQELEPKQIENQAHEDTLDIEDKYRADTSHDGKYKEGVDAKPDEKRGKMMGSGTETPPSTIPYMPLRSEIYPPVLNVKQNFR